MMELANHPEVQRKAWEEIVTVCGNAQDITWEHVHQMKCVLSSFCQK